LAEILCRARQLADGTLDSPPLLFPASADGSRGA